MAKKYYTVMLERVVQTTESYEWWGEAGSEEQAEELAIAETKKRGFNGWEESDQDISPIDVVDVDAAPS